MEAASDIMASEVFVLMEDGWVGSSNSLLVLGGVVVLDVGNNDVVGGRACSGGISTSSTEAREKDSFSETVAPDEKLKYIIKNYNDHAHKMNVYL